MARIEKEVKEEEKAEKDKAEGTKLIKAARDIDRRDERNEAHRKEEADDAAAFNKPGRKAEYHPDRDNIT